MPEAATAAREVDRTDYVGWAAAGVIVLAVFAVMAFFWFRYHP